MEGWGKGWRGEEWKAVISFLGKLIVMEESNFTLARIHAFAQYHTEQKGLNRHKYMHTRRIMHENTWHKEYKNPPQAYLVTHIYTNAHKAQEAVARVCSIIMFYWDRDQRCHHYDSVAMETACVQHTGWCWYFECVPVWYSTNCSPSVSISLSVMW